MHSIIHIGASEGSRLAEWLKGDARRIVLVEPNPVLAERLRQAASGHSHVKVVEAAVAAEPGSCELLEYNLPQASGLHEPIELKRLFPGLKLLHRHPISTISPQQLMAEYGPAKGDVPVHLILHAPGEEHAILQALMENDQLSRVSELCVTSSTVPHQPDTPPVEQTLGALKDYGFELTEHDAKDPDWQTWTLRLSPLKRRMVTLQQTFNEQLAQQEGRETRLQQELKAAREALDASQKARAEAEKAVAEHQQVTTQAQQTAQQRDVSLREVEQQLEQEQAAHKATTAAWEESREQLQQRTRKTEKQQQELVALQEKNQQLESDTQAIKQQVDAATTENAKLQKMLDGASAQNKKLQAENLTLEEGLKNTNRSLKQAEESRQASETTQQLEKVKQALKEEQVAHQATSGSLEEKKHQFMRRKQQAEKLQADLENLKKEAVRLESENKKLKQKSQALEEAQKKAREHQEKGQKAHQETAKLLEDHKGWLNNRTKKNAELQGIIEQKTKELENLRSQMRNFEELKQKLKKAECKAAERQEQVTELAETNRKITCDSQKLNERMSGLEKELIKAETQMATIKTLMLD
ncbi:hypothetical protein ACGTN6_17960 [Halomonas sp. THAF12]|uniref:hypothetical protein n=1 Tax=Halomonas sp. B23F22_10 TaxID=3459515 RepID=UPI00373E578C